MCGQLRYVRRSVRPGLPWAQLVSSSKLKGERVRWLWVRSPVLGRGPRRRFLKLSSGEKFGLERESPSRPAAMAWDDPSSSSTDAGSSGYHAALAAAETAQRVLKRELAAVEAAWAAEHGKHTLTLWTGTSLSLLLAR